MGCGIYYFQVKQIDRAMETMSTYGIEETDPAYQKLWAERGKLMTQIGQKFPRVNYALGMWREFSPERIRLHFDIENGWFSEARVRPGAPPIYKLVSDEEAMAILKDEIAPELKERLLMPDEYLGEG